MAFKCFTFAAGSRCRQRQRGGDATNTKTPKTQDVAPAATAKPQKAPKVR